MTDHRKKKKTLPSTAQNLLGGKAKSEEERRYFRGEETSVKGICNSMLGMIT